MPSDPDPVPLIARSLSQADLPDPAHSLVLLSRAQAGDRDALEDLVRRYQDRIRRIVRIQLGGSTLRRDYDSMDIVQNTFRAALPKIGDLRLRSASGLLQWLWMSYAPELSSVRRDDRWRARVLTFRQGTLQPERSRTRASEGDPAGSRARSFRPSRVRG